MYTVYALSIMSIGAILVNIVCQLFNAAWLAVNHTSFQVLSTNSSIGVNLIAGFWINRGTLKKEPCLSREIQFYLFINMSKASPIFRNHSIPVKKHSISMNEPPLYVRLLASANILELIETHFIRWNLFYSVVVLPGKSSSRSPCLDSLSKIISKLFN